MEWISVKDRLPNLGELAILYHRAQGRTGIGYLDFKDAPIKGNHAWRFQLVGEPENQTNMITHWMEWPDPPKQEQAEDDALKRRIAALEKAVSQLNDVVFWQPRGKE